MDDFAPQYVRDLAANLQKNSMALADAVLRYDSVEGLDLIALMATGGKLGYRQTLKTARALLNGDVTAETARELFDPSALAALARLAAGRPGDELDFTDSADLYRAVRAVRGDTRLPFDVDRLDAQTNLATGHFDYVATCLPVLKVDADNRWMIETELLHPIHGRPGSQTGPWLESFNRLFLDHGLLPLSIPDGEGEPFNRLDVAVPDSMIVSGPALPIVSIIMSSFKPDESMRTAVGSLLNQTWRNLEIIIVDDCSPPEFDDVLHEAEALDDRVRLVRMDQNGGTYKIRNHAMSLARGTFIAFQDSDDWSHPERIERQMAPLLERDDCVASLSRAARVAADMGTRVVGLSALRQNASSLLFRRGRVLDKLGGYDTVRKAADSEFIKRIEMVFGQEAIADLKIPLALVQLTGGSLSRADFRFGWEHGSRVAYRESFVYWHRLIAQGKESPLLDPEAERRFDAPARFLMTGQPPARSCDVLLISDWRSGIGRYFGAPREVRELSEAGLTTAIAQSESIRYALRRRQAPTDEIMELRSSGKTTIALWNEDLRAKLVLIRDPEFLNFPRAADTVKLKADRLMLVAGYPRRTPAGWLTYDPALVESHAREMFGVEPEWLPAHEGITESLRDGGATSDILPARRIGVVRLYQRSFTGLRGGPRPIVGTAGFDSSPKERLTFKALKLLLPPSDDYDVRIRADIKVIDKIRKRDPLPANWLVLDEADPAGFFRQLDFFVGLPMRSWEPEMSWPALEAIANGCVAILDPAYEEFFGDAALYTGDRTVKKLIDALTKDPAAFSRQQTRGYELAAADFSAESYVEFVTGLARPADPERK